ncbi:MAG: type 4a pilus biogenesis protein PilO [Deltaproteobacteria bacterium]|nr:type 4a pilus biogenesis protein PilO [Deltaproteobacteria bacterium]
MGLEDKIKQLMKFDSVIRMPLKTKLGMLGGACAVVAGLIGYLLVYPTIVKKKELEVNLVELTAKVEEQRKIAADIPKFKKEKEELDMKLQLALKQLPNGKEIPQLLEKIGDAAVKSGLSIKLFRPQPEKSTPEGFYSEVPVSMQVEGSFEAMYAFCAKIAKFDRIVNVVGLTIKGDNSPKADIPMLKSDFTALTYRFVPESERPPETPAAGAKGAPAAPAKK